MFGWKQSPPDERDLIFKPKFGAGSLPSIVNLSGIDGETKNQLNTSSCVGHSLGEINELLQRTSNPNNAFDVVSCGFPYYMGKKVYEGGFDGDTGMYIRDGIKAANKIGFCSEELYPLPPNGGFKEPTQEAIDEAKKNRFGTYYSIISKKEDRILEVVSALAQGFPIIFGSYLYDSFMEFEGGGIPMPDKKKEAFIGAHAMVAVGYNMELRAFFIKQSWGPNWALGGYAWMPFDYLAGDLTSDLWAISGLIKEE